MDFLTQWIMENITLFGYGGVIVLMALESANIPIPSEVTLPFAGFLVSQGKMDFHLAALSGALGCLIGSLPSYWLGRKFGRPFLERYGKWFFLRKKEIDLGDRWMKKYGNWTSFFSRLLPVVRTFISFVAGVWKAPVLPFAILTFVGSWIWSYLLVYVGFSLAQNWSALHPLWEKFDVAIIVLLAGMLVGYIWHQTRH